MDIRKLSYKMVDELYNKVLAKVKEIQGDKPYIDTQGSLTDGYDRMFFYGYTDLMSYQTAEGKIVGVRAVEDMVEILGYTASFNYLLTFDESSFKTATDNYENDEKTDDWESCWQPIKGNEVIMLVPTLFSIAEVIEQYEPES